MSTATCPKCHRQVSLPSTDDHSVWVRCPLCSSQYSLREALDHVPPALEILGPASAEMAMHGEAAVHGGILGGMAMHGVTAAHAEHATSVAPMGTEPMGAEHFVHPDHASNGEQPIDLEHPAPSGQPPALNQVNGLQSDASEHLVDFDLDAPEHSAPAMHGEPSEHLEHDSAATGLAEFHGDHRIEPSGGDPSLGEGEGDPEFRFSEEGSGENADEEHHAMGGIATLVQSAPPAKKRRQAPLVVKLIGVLVGLVFGLIGCYLVYGAFLFMGTDQFHLKQYFPTFISKHVPDVASPSRPSKPAAKTGTAEVNPAPAPSGGASDNATNTPPLVPPTTPPAGDNPTATVPHQGPAPTDLAQPSKKEKETGPLESTEDPLKTPPPDLDKPSKPDATGIAPPKFDSGPEPFGDVKPPVGPKPSVDKPATDKPSANKPTGDKLTVEPAIPLTEKPSKAATEKPTGKPADVAAPKSPVAAQLDKVDAAIAATVQAGEDLKTAMVPGADSKALLRPRALQYKAMSHLVTELGAVEGLPADPDSAPRVEQLKEKAAALAEPLGSSAERDTTAKLASKWVASPSRKENGVVVVGTLVKVEPSEKGFVARIKTGPDAKEMTFTTPQKPAAADGSAVVVLGLLNSNDGGSAIEIIGDKATADKPPAP